MATALIGPGDFVRQQQAGLAAAIVGRQFAAHPELEQRYGQAGREQCLQDASHHLAYLADAMNAGDPALFTHYVGWAKVMLRTRGIPMEDLARDLALARSVVHERLEGTAEVLAEEYSA